MPFANCIGNKRFWTNERILQGLVLAASQISGPLPCLDSSYNKLKKGRMDWPTSKRVCQLFGSMARGWLATGAPMERVSLHNNDWLPEERTYVLERAGIDTLDDIAKHLGRTYAATKTMLNKTFNLHARDNQGFFSAAQLAKEFDCSYTRIRAALKDGRLPGNFDSIRNKWNVDILVFKPKHYAILTKPKRTHTRAPTDLGDYRQRYGLHRKHLDVRVLVLQG